MRLLHTMLRVADLQKSIDFYTQVLDMKLIRKSENSKYKYISKQTYFRFIYWIKRIFGRKIWGKNF